MKAINSSRIEPMNTKEVIFNISMLLLRLIVIVGCFFVIAIMISEGLLVYFDMERFVPAVILFIIAGVLLFFLIKMLCNMIAFSIAWKKHIKISGGKEKIYPDIIDDNVKSIIYDVVPKELIAENYKAATLIIELGKSKGVTSDYTDNKEGKRVDYTLYFYDNASNDRALLAKGFLRGEPTPFTKLKGVDIKTVPSDKLLENYFKELSRIKFLLSGYNRFLYHLETNREKK